MTMRPIIFSAPMVRALLDGRKTMTRRVLKAVPEPPADDNTVRVPVHAKPYLDAYCSGQQTLRNPRGIGRNWCWWTRDDRACEQFRVGYVPSDLLWVRETWKPIPEARPGGYFVPGSPFFGRQYYYRADNDCPLWANGRWRPSIHMPRKASRLTLQVTAIKVERLQQIAEADAIAEGAYQCDGGWSYGGSPLAGTTARGAFYCLWKFIHGAGAWDANPFVVAITFEVIRKNIGEVS